MARKKKTKKTDGETKSGAREGASDGSEGGADEQPGPKKKRRRPRKKGAPKKPRKKSGKQRKKSTATEPSPPPAQPPEPEPADDGAMDGLGAEVAVLDEVAAGEQAATSSDEPEDAPVPVEDIDAVLGGDETEDLAALIAETVAGAEPDDHAKDQSVASLDEDPDGGTEAASAAESADSDGAEPEASVEQEAKADEPAVPEAVAAPSEDPDAPPEEMDLTGAIDLGPEITPELRDRLLAQALAHVELQDARYRLPYGDPRPTGRWKAVVAAGLILVAGVVAAVPPGWVRPERPAQLDAAGRARGIRSALLLQAQQVDAFRVRFQRLPESLDDLPRYVPGLRYVHSGNRAYQLIGYEPDGNAIVYDSTNPAPEFRRLAERLAEEGRP